MKSTKQKLIPARVPWQIVASTPLLQLSAAEGEEAIVRFAAHFALEHEESDEREATTRVGYESVQIVGIDSIKKAAPGDRRAPFKVIKNTFSNSPAARFLPAYSGSQVVSEEDYEWAEVSGRSRPGEEFEKWSRRTDEEWSRTSICPDPGFYEVARSRWLAEMDVARFGMKHFLITGHDNYVEVIAKDWTWSVESILDDW